jgi:hypothetical protein
VVDQTPQAGVEARLARLRRALDANPELVAVGAYALLTVAATITAYFTIFTYFAPYDDEGTLLVGLKSFVDGEALYADVWSVYGPFYYEFFGGIFSIFGLDVTTDASRTLVALIWVATSLCFGLAAHRLTRSLWLGLTGMVAAFAGLVVLINEPMHPMVLCVLLIAAFTLLVACGPTKRPLWLGAAAGALLAALLLTKVNLGAFAIAAAVAAAAFTVWPLASRTWIRWLVGAAFLAMPVVVMGRDLDLSWAREFALIEVLAIGSVLVACLPLRPRGPDRVLWRTVLGGVAGFIGALVLIVLILLLTGPSLSDAFDGIIRKPLGIRDVLLSAPQFPAGSALTWAVGALAASVIATRVLRSSEGRPALWSALVRAVAGLAIWLAIAHIIVIGLNPSSQNPVLVPMLLAWIAVIPPAGAAETPYKRFLRALLPALAVAQTLQIYPVPGSQLGIASVSFVAVGALCLSDALTELKAVYAAGPALSLQRLTGTVAVASVALAGVFALNSVVLPGGSAAKAYKDATKLDLPGASLLRIGAESAEQYEGLVELLHSNGCTTFIGWPNVNSLYLWSELPPPTPSGPNGWFYALDDEQQQQAVDDLRAAEKPCAIRNDDLAASYLKNEAPPDKPLVNYVEDNFRPVAEVGPFQFMLSKPSATQ